MRLRTILSSTLITFLDCLGATFIALYSLIIGPLGVLRGPLLIERLFLYFWVLAPARALARAMRIALDWRMGHFHLAIAQAEELIASIEESCKLAPSSRARKRVLADLYGLLTRAYLHTGQIDEAMTVILRAHKRLGLERLEGLGGIDAKTAHLVRAGLAAGRLLEGSGLAAMFIKSPPKQESKPSGVTGTDATSANGNKNPKASEHVAKIIPFPLNT